MDDGQRLCPFRANPNIADPTDPSDPTDPADPSDPSEKPTDQTAILRAIPSLEATTPIKIFVAVRVVRG